ncbi:class I SAM-dependent methyltransferase [Paraburkholderia fungorum]|uniref:class I SAM-dependent methyltransferase n=1 Tax=Paraburkholderia fungorum TaxID=134537 RepID=UPI0038BBC821
MRRIKTWLTQCYLSLKAFSSIARRLDGLERAALEHNGRLAWLESAIIEHNGRLDRLEDSVGDMDSQSGSVASQLSTLMPLLRLLPGERPAFAWMAPPPDWLDRAEQRIGRPRATLSPMERQQAFYSYYSEMGGDHGSILRQQYQAYLPLLQKAASEGGRVLDIGCGAGEFLSFLREKDLAAVGVDLSGTEVQRALSAGLEAVHASGDDFLRNTPERFAGITLFQVIEHLAPDEVLPTLEACVQRLLPGGVLLVETINLRHPLALNGFYTDPTHQKPLSDNYLGFVLQWLGLRDVGVLYTLPEPLPGVSVDEPQRLYANYTVFGFAPHSV